MANSPKNMAFFLYIESTGAPKTGATPTFTTYKDMDGNNLSQPGITEIGGGAYEFTPVFPAETGIVAVIDGGAGNSPRYQSVALRPEDYNVDLLTDLTDEAFGTWEIPTTGPDANRLIFYRADGVTVLQKFDLFDENGDPTYTNPFKREPL